MFLSKIWFTIVALMAGVALTIALAAPRPIVKKLAELEGQRLDRAEYAAEQMFKVDAHKWIDRVGKLGRDAILADALDAASRGAGESAVVRKTVQDRVRALIPDLASGGIETLLAVDTKGRVVARVGEEEKDAGDLVGGQELVADALHGYLSDDVWGQNGRLRRVAAAPVLSKSRDHVVGALVVAAETGAAFAERLKKNLEVDVALLLRGKIVTATQYGQELAQLPQMVVEHAKEIAELKRTPALEIPAGRETLLAVVAPFPGQASQQEAYYALIGKKPIEADLKSLLANTTTKDLKWGDFPWVQLVGGIGLVIAIGILFFNRELDSPAKRLRGELGQLARGEIQRLRDSNYGGKFGGIARDVNAAVEHYTHAPAAPAPMASKDLNAILNDRPPPPAFGVAPGQGPGLGAPPIMGGRPSPVAPPQLSGLGAPPQLSGLGPPQLSGLEDPGNFEAPPPPPFMAPPTGTLSGLPPAPFNPLPINVATPTPSPAVRPASLPGSGTKPLYGVPSQTPPVVRDPLETTRVVGDGAEDDEAHFRQVYEEFLAAKSTCGESTNGLTLEKFRQRLMDSRSQMIAKHGCRTVRFTVYVKDGKAALRSSPVT